MKGAASLLSMRMKGHRPPGLIVITESLKVARNARQRGLFTLILDDGEVGDWRIVRGLWVGIVTYLNREKVAPICQAILEAEPRMFGVTYLGYKEIEHDRVISAAR